MELNTLIFHACSLLLSLQWCTAVSIRKEFYNNELHNQNDVLHRERRKVTNKDSRLWPGGVIPYVVEDVLMKNFALRAAIEESIFVTERDTCIQFDKINEGLITDTNFTDNHRYVAFVKGIGCHSSVGMGEDSGMQEISIGRSCGFPEMVLHELGHLLGLWHEQARPDRDAHVQINWGNILGGMEHNFKMVDNARLWAPYDLSSAMHYSLQTFNKNDGRTIQPLDDSLSFLVGYRRDFSFYDLYTIHRMYGCADHCPEESPKCQNEGFLNKDCQCVCPRLLTGETCEEIETDDDCGGVINIDYSTSITSPNYPEDYPNNKNCAWLLKSPPGTIMTLKMHEVVIERTDSGLCRDMMEIRSTNIGIDRGPVRCGEFSDESINTTTNKLILNFISNRHYSGRGFNFSVHIRPRLDCASDPCQNGGTCEFVEDMDDYMCFCAESFIGKNCEIQVVDGEFTEWSEWSECTAACGLQHRSRSCTEPVNGGRDCTGITQEMRHCDSNSIDCSEQYICDFGVKGHRDNCGMSIEGNGGMEWSLISSHTPSLYTGPQSGHTTGHDDDYYVYMEGSFGAYMDTTIFWLPTRQWDAGFYCLQFFYYMRGADVGTLQVLRHTGATNSAAVMWQYSHNKGEKWIEANVDLLLFRNVQIGFLGVRGDGINSDIAIDDISISPGSCSVDKPQNDCEHPNAGVQRGGKHFKFDQNCFRKRCFCNHGGDIDCPRWDKERIDSCTNQNSGNRITKKKSSPISSKKRARQRKRQRELQREKRRRQKLKRIALERARNAVNKNLGND